MPAAHRLAHDPELCIAFVDIIGIEEFAVAPLVPIGRILGLGVTGIGDGFKEGFEAGRIAGVLGRAAMLAEELGYLVVFSPSSSLRA